jgi:glutathione S-transferase
MAGDAVEGSVGVAPSPEGDLRLYFSPDACSRVTLIAMEETGAPYTTHRVSLKDGDQRQPSFRRLNPKGKVPVLQTSQGILTENVAILSYLAGRFPQADLLPAEGDWERAQALSTLSWCASTVHPLLTLLRYPERFCDVAQAPVRVRALAAEKLQAQLQAAEAQLEARRWILGERRSVADAYLFWIWGRCAEAGFEPSNHPRLEDLHARVAAWPSVRRALERERAGAVRTTG